MTFNHFDARGQAHMVDVGDKPLTRREAEAEAVLRLGPALLARVLEAGTAKGDVLQVARLAGIQAVKRTGDLIPLAHPVAVCHVAVEFTPDAAAGTLAVRCTAVAVDRTGVEMEAMTGAAAAALTVYDMCKGQDRTLVIERLRLLRKSGGRSGEFVAPEPGV